MKHWNQQLHAGPETWSVRYEAPLRGLQEIAPMDIITVLFEGFRIIFGLLSLFFVPGLVISLVYFPRVMEIGIVQRLIYSVFFSIVFVIAAVLFLVGVLGVDTTSKNMNLVTAIFLALMLVLWLSEVFSLNKTVQKYFSRIINTRRDRFTHTAMTTVVWHESIKSGRNHVDHSYLIDIGKEIEIQRVDENQWKVSEGGLIPPPHPKTRYFELAIREYREEGLSLIDDLQVYPVKVTVKPGPASAGRRKKHTTPKISRRIYEKTDKTEIQWIYSHDFHLFAILFSQDTLGQMVDRVLIKLDEIALSIKRGSRISSHMEETQKLKDEFDIVLERPRRVPSGMARAAQYQESRNFIPPTESDRRKILAEIVKDLHVTHITPETFRTADKGGITDIKIPEKAGVDKILASIRELDGDDWLFE